MKQYETIIGLEVHVELATRTKIFCGCSTAFGGTPNTHTCPVCTGMPGSLPVLNKKVVEFALRAGLATNCSINQYCKFDRKNYFYPDNPQNYQISQLYLPICHDGFVEIETEAGKKKVRIHEMHMEEDAGKLIHDEWEDCSLVDYNRSGVPLIEIVSEPDMRSADEVIAYLEKLRCTMQYLGVSDCKLQEGSMRACAPCAAERGIFPELRWYHGHSVRPEPTVNQPARGVFCSMREPSGPAEHKGGAEYEAGQIGGGTFSGTVCGLCHRKPRADGARRLHERRRKRYLFPVSALAPRHPQAGADHPRRDGCDWRTGGVHACGAARRAVGGIGPICERGKRAAAFPRPHRHSHGVGHDTRGSRCAARAGIRPDGCAVSLYDLSDPDQVPR